MLAFHAFCYQTLICSVFPANDRLDGADTADSLVSRDENNSRLEGIGMLLYCEVCFSLVWGSSQVGDEIARGIDVHSS